MLIDAEAHIDQRQQENHRTMTRTMTKGERRRRRTNKEVSQNLKRSRDIETHGQQRSRDNKHHREGGSVLKSISC